MKSDPGFWSASPTLPINLFRAGPHRSETGTCDVRILCIFIFALSVAGPAALLGAQSTSAPDAGARFSPTAPSSSGQAYSPPSEKELLHDYLLDLAGPYPIFTASASAGIHMATDSPPEWRQGAAAYGKRFASSFGIGAVETSTRYGLSEALNEDTLYYPCECTGIFPRIRHAVVSSFTARRRDNGERVLSFPSVAAPYAGTFAGVYGWYPSRYGAADALRMGSNGLLCYVGGNIALEFLAGGAHPLLAHLHITIPNGSGRSATH
jgi:hypothetical protein